MRSEFGDLKSSGDFSPNSLHMGFRQFHVYIFQAKLIRFKIKVECMWNGDGVPFGDGLKSGYQFD